MMSYIKQIIVTGYPGVGKTTLIKKTCETFQKENALIVNGFITEDIRNEGGSRIGFDVVTTDGRRRRLARTKDHISPSDSTKYRIGQYIVFPNEFESILSLFEMESDILIIDEIGKMELLSEKFKQILKTIFENPNKVIIATIPVSKGKPIPIVEEIRNSPLTNLITVDKNNRNDLLDKIIGLMKEFS